MHRTTPSKPMEASRTHRCKIANMDSVDTKVEADLERARQIVAMIPLPAEVVDIVLRKGRDWYGEAALWADIHVRNGIEPDRDTVKRLTDFSSDVQARLIEGGVTVFPYTNLEQAA